MHATLAGEMQKSNEHFFKIVKQMREIESVIKMVDPSFKINRIAVRRMQRVAANQQGLKEAAN